ncbi:hypothetical protein K438DRAFT_2061563 [Mycena galopus ATCC 62051]|nr:hypothetical protein K438DRAFT_2061563 [Mycena galopus ATCC 62051]
MGYNERLKLSEEAIKTDIPTANIRRLTLDFSSLAEVRKAAAVVNTYSEPIHVLINIGTFKLTVDGLESQTASDHVGPFLFIKLIAPKPPRVVLVASVTHAFRQGVNFELRHHRAPEIGDVVRQWSRVLPGPALDSACWNSSTSLLDYARLLIELQPSARTVRHVITYAMYKCNKTLSTNVGIQKPSVADGEFKIDRITHLGTIAAAKSAGPFVTILGKRPASKFVVRLPQGLGIELGVRMFSEPMQRSVVLTKGHSHNWSCTEARKRKSAEPSIKILGCVLMKLASISSVVGGVVQARL